MGDSQIDRVSAFSDGSHCAFFHRQQLTWVNWRSGDDSFTHRIFVRFTTPSCHATEFLTNIPLAFGTNAASYLNILDHWSIEAIQACSQRGLSYHRLSVGPTLLGWLPFGSSLSSSLSRWVSKAMIEPFADGTESTLASSILAPPPFQTRKCQQGRSDGDLDYGYDKR